MRTLIALLLMVVPASAQIDVPESTAPFQPIVARLTLSIDENSEATVNWTADPGATFIPSAERFGLHVWAKPGEHWLKASATIVKFEKRQVFVPDPQDPTNVAKAKLETLKVFVSSEVREFPVKPFRVTEAPRPPPDPTPDPKPDPTPDPKPDPQPTPGKISVLMIEDTAKRPLLPRPQLDAMTSQAVRGYLNAHCAKAADGTPQWRLWHVGNSAEHEAENWQRAMAQFKAISPAPALPYIMISNGVTGYGGPLPQTEADLMALLRKWGGA